jgi:hypothetical protein
VCSTGYQRNELKWKPHPKSMSLGQLALHVANIPGDLIRLAQLDHFDAADANFEPPMPDSKDAVMNAFETSLSAASEYLATLASEAAGAPWLLTLRGTEVFSMPRGAMLRSLLQGRLACSGCDADVAAQYGENQRRAGRTGEPEAGDGTQPDTNASPQPGHGGDPAEAFGGAQTVDIAFGSGRDLKLVNEAFFRVAAIEG